jgi:hypothetical protein
MWLVYLRFDGNGRTKGGHVRCPNELEARAAVERAQKPDASFESSRLTEYALYYSHATIREKVAPTSGEPVFREGQPE